MADASVNVDIVARLVDEASEGFKGMNTSVGELASGVFLGQMAFQAFSTAVHDVTDFVNSSIDTVQELGLETRTLTAETGMSAEQVTGFIAVLDRFNVSGSQASMALKTFSKQIEKTTDDNRQSATAFDLLNLKVKDSHGTLIDTNTLLMDVADKFKGMKDGAEKTAIATTLFGRAAANMIPLLDQGSAGIQELEGEAAKMGLVLSTDNVAQVQKYIMKQKDMNEAITGMKLQIGLGLMPIITQYIGKVMDWINAHGGVVAIYNAKVKPFLDELHVKIDSFVKNDLPNIIRALKDLGDVFGFLGNLIGGFAQLMGDLQNWFQDAVYSIVRVWVGIPSWFQGITRSIGNFFKDLWQGMKDDANQAINDIVNFFASLPGRVTHAIGNVGSSVANDIKSAMHTLHIPGFAGGVENYGGGWAVVGEKGPEMMYVPQGASVYNQSQMSSMNSNSSTNFYGDMNFGSAGAVSAFFSINGRNSELASHGMTTRTA